MEIIRPSEALCTDKTCAIVSGSRALYFDSHHLSIDGARMVAAAARGAEDVVEVFGREQGIGARSAVGMGPLPGNIAVEIEVIFELA